MIDKFFNHQDESYNSCQVKLWRTLTVFLLSQSKQKLNHSCSHWHISEFSKSSTWGLKGFYNLFWICLISEKFRPRRYLQLFFNFPTFWEIWTEFTFLRDQYSMIWQLKTTSKSWVRAIDLEINHRRFFMPHQLGLIFFFLRSLKMSHQSL